MRGAALGAAVARERVRRSADGRGRPTATMPVAGRRCRPDLGRVGRGGRACPCPAVSRAGPFRTGYARTADGLSRGDARLQVTVNRAPPAGERPDRPAAARRADDRVADREAQARAAGLGRGRHRAVEPVEDQFRVLLGDPGPGVVHGHGGARALGGDRHVHGPTLGRVLARVVEQHADEPVHQVRRRGDQHLRRRDVDAEAEAARLGDDGEAVGGLRGEHAEVHRLRRRRRGGGIEPGQPEHVLQQPAHPLGLAGPRARRRRGTRRRRAPARGRARCAPRSPTAAFGARARRPP